ncbi:YqjD family protein [Paracoccus litorisediminis]|uniref:DUF883 family protein n=1 Tax=Paracoccus litorisediminis TaxID=2006130 RepID=A0A844HST5_9RHOB|nr:DUF883 family protein [Paracoccus litorisediminis]MTH61494.1 DUF883 family protein [Paracoccus litorisediminis]
MPNHDPTNDLKAEARRAAEDIGREARRAADDAADAAESAKARGSELLGSALEKGAEFVDSARKRGGEYYEGARSKGSEYAEHARDEARRIYREGERRAGDAAAYAEDYYDDLTVMVRRNPGQALGIAVGVGFLLGLIVARR